MKPVLSVIVPVYNEEAVINESYKRLTDTLKNLETTYELIFINDGSRDKSAIHINDIIKKDRNVRLLNFSRNFGHQAAITAGMEYARGDAIVIIDADLQDPPEIIPEMMKLWKEGNDVVYGKRLKRKGETLFKKITASIYYRILKSMTSFEIPLDTGDFRLIDRKVNEAMKSLPERSRYVRGLISWVGFKQTAVEYVRDERFAGETKYPLKKMIKFAVDGICAFSYKPLKLATYLGLIISAISFIYLVVVLYQKLFTNSTVEGWASIIAIVLLTQGIVLIVLGLMGEYIGRIFDEMKHRPIYIVKEALGYENDNNQ